MRGAGIGKVCRRHFLAGAGLVACTRRTETAAPRPSSPGPVELHSFFDLPADDPRSRELSGIVWDPSEGVLWAVQDESPNLVALAPDAGLHTWRFGKALSIAYPAELDLEGVVLTAAGFIVASETGPHLVEVDRSGRFLRELPLPERFRDARHNKSLESLTLSPSGRYLFTTTEVALPCDGELATLAAGTRVRIVRMDRRTGQIDEYAYATDPAPYDHGDWGVSDLAAISDDELLVLERGWAERRGNTARVHYVTIDDHTTTCGGVDALSSTTPSLTKRLYVDLARLVARGLPAPKQPQDSAIMDNYEGLAIGPRLPDGRASLIVVSDDNGHSDQVARLLVLACR